MKKSFIVCIIFMFAIVLVGCGETITIDITMNGNKQIGGSYELEADISGVESEKVEWAVDNSSVAKIENGKLVIVGGGKATITATYKKVVSSLEINIYTISYDANKGSLDGSQVTSFSDPSAVSLPTPTRSDYDFDGWYQGDSKVSTIQAQNYELKASWTLHNYDLEFDLDGGQFVEEDVVLPTTRTIDDYIDLPELKKEGYTFEGWYNNASFEGEALVELNSHNMDYSKFYAKFTVVNYPVSFELNGGESNQLPEQKNIESNIELPKPTKEFYSFEGWYDNASFEGEAITHLNSASYLVEKLYAKWSLDTEAIAEYNSKGYSLNANYIVYDNSECDGLVINDVKYFAKLDDAIAAAQAGDIIYVAAGSYTLGAGISKNLTIYGVNAGSKATGEEEVSSQVVVTANAVALSAKSVVFDGLELVGSAASSDGGVYFTDAKDVELIKFVNCHIHRMNTFFKSFYLDTLRIENCHIADIGQFAVWAVEATTELATTVKNTYLVGCSIDAASCGTVSNGNAALFRIRCGNMYAFNNYIYGDVQSLGGVFDASVTGSLTADKEYLVKYNKIENVTKLVIAPGATEFPMIFDNNLYVSNGSALETAPSNVSGKGVTADTTVAKTEAELKAAYESFVNAQA